MGEIETKRSMTTATRRRLIIETAAMCFIDKGFHQTSVREIAAKAGISLGNLYNHFENKAALIAEIATLEAEEMVGIEEVLKQETASTERLEKFVVGYFDYVSQPVNTILAAEILAEALRNSEVAKGFEKNKEQLVALLAAFLKTGQKQGAFVFDERPVEIANLLLDMMEGAAMRVSFDLKRQKTKTKKTLFQVIKRLVQE